MFFLELATNSVFYCRVSYFTSDVDGYLRNTFYNDYGIMAPKAVYIQSNSFVKKSKIQ